MLRQECLTFGEPSPHEITIAFLEQGLHNEPDRLRVTLQAAIDAAPTDIDAVLIVYGLCSNGIQGVRAGSVPLVVPRAHDCITLFLGSRQRYAEYFRDHPGTYWYTAGWIDTGTQPGRERYERSLEAYIEEYGEENGRYIMEMTEGGWVKNYKNAAYVDLGIADGRRHRAYTKECADYFGWTCDFLKGDPRLIEALFAGDWDPDDFLVVRPGHTVLASHDANIIEASG